MPFPIVYDRVLNHQQMVVIKRRPSMNEHRSRSRSYILVGSIVVSILLSQHVHAQTPTNKESTERATSQTEDISSDAESILRKYGFDPSQLKKTQGKTILATDMKKVPPVPPNLDLDVGKAHKPFVQGECDICHVRADHKDPGPIHKSQSNICFSCHVELLTQMSTVRYLHEPFQKNCQFCHNPHNSQQRSLLVSTTTELCLACHKETQEHIAHSSVQHGAVTSKKACTNCHNPHGSNIGSLLANLPYFLCVSCHSVEEIKDKRGKLMLNFEKLFSENPYRHAPVENRECSVCHNPHGGQYFRILMKEYTHSFYTPYERQRYELCYGCHPHRIIEENPTHFTGFREGKNNIHYLHVIEQEAKGRSCHVCHDVHATKHPFHIRDDVLFDDSEWKLELNFELRPHGGTCDKTCHTERPYSRGPKEIEPRLRKTSAVDQKGRSHRLFSNKWTTILLFINHEQPYSLQTLEQLKTCEPVLSDKNTRLLGVISANVKNQELKPLLESISFDFPVILDRQAQFVDQLGIKVQPIFVILDNKGHIIGKQTISKVNVCDQLTKRIALARGEISEEEFAKTINPTPPITERNKDISKRYAGLATNFLKKKLYKKAEEAIHVALKFEPDSALAHAILRAILFGQGSKPRLEIGRTTEPVIVDGVLEEFEGIDPLSIRAGNATAEFRLLWNDDYLFAAVAVSDPLLFGAENTKNKKDIKDSVEIFLDPNNDQNTDMDENDRQLIVTADSMIFFKDAKEKILPLSDTDAVQNLQHAVTSDGTLNDQKADNGYNIELAISWKSLGVQAATNVIIGFDLALNDQTSSGQFTSTWAGINSIKTPKNWNELALVQTVSLKPKIEEIWADAGTGEKARQPSQETTADTKEPTGGCGCNGARSNTRSRLPVLLKNLLWD